MKNTTEQVLQLTWTPRKSSTGQVVFFDGVGYGTCAGLLTKLTSPIHDGAEFSVDMLGEWLAVIQLPHVTEVHTDYFGFYHLFYTTPDLNGIGVTAVSASFAALTSYLRDRGCQPSPDLAYALPLMASTSSFFNQGFSPRTSCAQIKRLLPGQTIQVGTHGTSINSDQRWGDHPCASYSDLIDIGVSKIRQQLANLDLGGIQKKELFLSGGKDSRTCLALMLARRSHNFTCTTNEPASGRTDLVSEVLERDFAISVQLVSHYNLRWTKPVARQAEWKSFAECLQDYRRFRSNKYYSFTPANFQTFSTEDNIYIEIHGGCGEALRGYWGKYFRKLPVSGRFKKTRGNIWHDAAVIFQSLVPRQSIPQELHSLSMREFVTDMRAVPGNTIYEVMDNHYALHRNRYHFGNVRQAFEIGKLLYYPLAQKEFLLASQKLPYTERCQGRLLYDIIRQSTPSAHLFPYESGFFECAPPPTVHIPITKQAIDDVSEEYFSVQQLRMEQSRQLYAAGRNYDIKAAMTELALTNLEIIMDSSIELRDIYEGQQLGRASRSLANPVRNHYISRLDGIAQVFAAKQSYELMMV